MSIFEQLKNGKQKNQLLRPVQQERTNSEALRPENPLLKQQQVLGNQAMLRFAQSYPLGLPNASLYPTGGACHTCPAHVQPKLTIGQPGDKYEQEADRIVEQVMRIPEPQVRRQANDQEEEELVQTNPIAGEITPLIQKQVEEEEEELLQTKEADTQTPQVDPKLATKIHSLRGRGQPLPKSVRSFFEPRFGYDFSQVRVHTDARAIEIARTLNARALTSGYNVMFAAGLYTPETYEGYQLLAHELTHVVQQVGKSSQSNKGPCGIYTVRKRHLTIGITASLRRKSAAATTAPFSFFQRK